MADPRHTLPSDGMQCVTDHTGLKGFDPHCASSHHGQGRAGPGHGGTGPRSQRETLTASQSRGLDQTIRISTAPSGCQRGDGGTVVPRLHHTGVGHHEDLQHTG